VRPAWLEAGRITGGPLFRRLTFWRRVGDRRLSVVVDRVSGDSQCAHSNDTCCEKDDYGQCVQRPWLDPPYIDQLCSFGFREDR
jgi:hypothetical protein